MSVVDIESVQLYRCTDESTRHNHCRPSQTSYHAVQARCRHRAPHPEGLSDRTVYPLWKTRLQVCKHCRPRPQILPVGQLSRSKTSTGLRSAEIPRSGQGVPLQLSTDQRIIRGDLQYQSRTSTTERHAVATEHEHLTGFLHFHRDHAFGNHRGRYASRLSPGGTRRHRHWGGTRCFPR